MGPTKGPHLAFYVAGRIELGSSMGPMGPLLQIPDAPCMAYIYPHLEIFGVNDGEC